jgi:hypothetical protein
MRAAAKERLRVTVYPDGRIVAEPVDAKPQEDARSGGEDATPLKPGRWRD